MKTVIFTGMKNRCVLHGRVFVMIKQKQQQKTGKMNFKLSYIVHVGRKMLLFVVKAGEIQSTHHAIGHIYTIGKYIPCGLSFVYTSQVKLTVRTEPKFGSYLLSFM